MINSFLTNYKYIDAVALIALIKSNIFILSNAPNLTFIFSVNSYTGKYYYKFF